MTILLSHVIQNFKAISFKYFNLFFLKIFSQNGVFFKITFSEYVSMFTKITCLEHIGQNLTLMLKVPEKSCTFYMISKLKKLKSTFLRICFKYLSLKQILSNSFLKQFFYFQPILNQVTEVDKQRLAVPKEPKNETCNY